MMMFSILISFLILYICSICFHCWYLAFSHVHIARVSELYVFVICILIASHMFNLLLLMIVLPIHMFNLLMLEVFIPMLMGLNPIVS